MNIEEKAKAYDEALALAKRLISNNCTEVEKLCLKCVFPELKESEDEEIRKGLVNFILYKAGHLLDEETEHKFIAYLEKQKEQKPILEVFGFKVGDAVRLKDGDGRKHIIKSFEEVEGLHGPIFHVEFEDDQARDSIYPGEEYPNGYYTHMEKFEDEQKTAEWNKATVNGGPIPTENQSINIPLAEWSEEDESMLEEVISNISEDYVTADYEEILSWLKTLKYRVQPKQKWDEVDKRMLGKCVDAASGYYNPEDKPALKDWLKSLPERFVPQSKQEWSEEDKKKIERLRSVINQLASYTDSLDVNGDYCEGDYAELDDWLESLPERFNLQPKPTEWNEEDKKIYEDIMSALEKSFNANRCYFTSYDVTFLKSLRPQPHWKPSEEQMEALNYAITEWDGGKRLTGLYALRNDLKKLI